MGGSLKINIYNFVLNCGSGNIAGFIFAVVGNDNLVLLNHAQFRHRVLVSSFLVAHQSGSRDAVFSKVDLINDADCPFSYWGVLMDHQNQVAWM